VMAAAMAGYVIARYAGKLSGNAEEGVMVLTAAGNLFGRLMPKPGALIRLPGIIMLVPGSTSMRGFMDVVEHQSIHVGQDELLGVTNVVMALVAGLLFGNLLIPTRKNL
ncbi:threonine/serine exporter family protein, partial [Xylella fastidiosa subsp. multiplex]